MAISDATLSDVMAAKLEELLQRAHQVKQSTAIDPPLQVSKLAADNRPLLGPISGDKEIHMLAFEKAAKNIFYDKLVRSPQAQSVSCSHVIGLNSH